MAARPDDDQQLSDAMGALSVDDEGASRRLDGRGLDNLPQVDISPLARAKMAEITNEYESVFSWDIKGLTGTSENLISNLTEIMGEKCEMIGSEGDVFDISRFYVQLIICYEHYESGDYKKSLSEVEKIVKDIDKCKFEDSSNRYSEACRHIARASCAYVLLTLNLDSEETMRTIKPVIKFNKYENAAINAIKSRVFMEYPPKGNDIGLQFADLARNLDSSELEWIIIWLKAQGRVRRFHGKFIMPDQQEMDAANMLCAANTKVRPLIQASKLYLEVAIHLKKNNNSLEANKFYKFSSDLTYKAIGLARENVKQLKSCFITILSFPVEFHSKKILDEVVEILINVKNNSHVDSVLGKYYLIHKQYQKAKIHLSRGMAAGHFSSALQLIKVELLLQPRDYPLIDNLIGIYEGFPSPKRRLIILSQILMYYYYNEENPSQLMKFVKLYLEQNIDNSLKQHHLITTYPLFKTNRYFLKQKFLTSLFSEMKYLKSHHKWTPEEKIIIEQTLSQFNDMMNENKNPSNINDKIVNRNFGMNSNAKDGSNWRKKTG